MTLCLVSFHICEEDTIFLSFFFQFILTFKSTVSKKSLFIAKHIQTITKKEKIFTYYFFKMVYVNSMACIWFSFQIFKEPYQTLRQDNIPFNGNSTEELMCYLPQEYLISSQLK